MLAKKLGWKVGDEVTLESGTYRSDARTPATFTIVGIYTAATRSADRSSFLFHWDYLNDSLPPSMRDTIILGNTISMTARERTNEFGVLRALGFRPAHVAALLFGEAIVIGARRRVA